MTEQTLKLDIPAILPGVSGEQDQRLTGLMEALRARHGICKVHIDEAHTPQALCLHYDPAQVSDEDVRALARQVVGRVAGRYVHTALEIDDLDCSDCAMVIEHSLGRMPGVTGVHASFAEGRVQVDFDRSLVRRQAIERRLKHLGYHVRPHGLRQWLAENGELLESGLAGVLLLATWVGGRWLGLPELLQVGGYLSAAALAGRRVAGHAWHALRKLHFDTDLLMLVAAMGAFFLGEFAEGALLLFLFGLGHALEERALDRAHAAVRSLAALAPRTARVRRGEAVVEVGVTSIELDEIVIVPPGQRIPVDGVVTSGSSAVDQSSVTGESIPVEKNSGSAVYAGTVNGDGALEVRVGRLAKDSTLQRVMRLVEEAQASKSPTQLSTQRFMRYFVPTVLVVDVLVMAVPPLFGVPFDESFRRAMTLLVAASPCALALGAPSAILAGVARAARGGVLVKGGVHLENLGRIRALAFDKTGTLTFGRPELTDIVAAQGWTDEQVLQTAAAVESRSAHPLAQAVTRAAAGRALVLPPIEDAEAVVGRGFKARFNGQAALVGSQMLFEEAGVRPPEALRRKAEALESQGRTVLWVAVQRGNAGWQTMGLLAVTDRMRPEAPQAIHALRKAGVQRVALFSGDHSIVARAVGAQAGVDLALGELMPEQKLEAVRRLEKETGATAMIGDGVNDAPALAAATVGIAMGGAGSDAALESADVALMGDDLNRLPFAMSIGRASAAVMRQNLAFALGIILLLAVAALTGLVGLGLAVFLHEGSTVVVVMNSLRLLRAPDR